MRKKKNSKATQQKQAQREIEESPCPLEAVTVHEEDAVRMVVSGGSKHALTVLWMGRWFSGSLISVPPLQETVPVGGTFTTEGEFLRALRSKNKDKKEEARWIMWTVLIAGFCTVGVSFRHFYSFAVPGAV
ncbi:hypothetical protein WN48_02706 [Eufriesea mexicana]|uniref:Transmembrane protein n=1 Tax=Eufriesea mexicana TaxID=516756 RepID=A0A310SKE2_9HYME|nr:hypothetical protein WN48_02706 [Eufriesea mexicana]